MSTNGRVVAQDEAMDTAAKAVEACQSDLIALNNTLSSTIDSYKAHWKGAGGDAFFALSTLWSDRQKKIANALETFHQGLKGTRKDGSAANESAASSLKNASSNLENIGRKLGGL